MKYMALEWASYRRAVMRADAGEVQVCETRRAFYAGAIALHNLVMRNLEPGSEVTERDLHTMQELTDELLNFGIEQAAAEKQRRGMA